MIENALDVLDVALAAAEPGRRSGYFVPSKSRGELVLVTTPDGYVQRYQEFIDLIIGETGVRAQPSEFVDSQQGMSWFRVDGYAVVGDKRLLELFDGASADLAGAVETWNVAYDPNGGSNKHVLESLTEVFDDVKNKPGVVVAPAILAVKLRATRFNRVIAKHLQEFWRDSVHLSYEYKRDDMYLVRYLYAGKPKFTPKSAATMAQLAESGSAKFLSLCQDYLQQMRLFSARTARVAYKFSDE